MIKHNCKRFLDKVAHSLGFQMDDGQGKADYEVFALERGFYDFGTAHRSQTITLIHGGADISGTCLIAGETTEIPKRGHLKIEVFDFAVYTCKHGPREMHELFSQNPSTLSLSLLATNKTKTAKIKTIEALVKLPPDDAFYALGRKAFGEIVELLVAANLRFGMTDEEIRTWTPDE